MKILKRDRQEICELLVLSQSLTQIEIHERLKAIQKIAPESLIECLLVLRKLHDRA